MSKHATALQAIDKLKDFYAAVDAAKAEMLGGEVLDRAPEGYITGPDFARYKGVSAESATAELARLHQKGKFDRVRAFGLNGAGRRMAMWYYRPKK